MAACFFFRCYFLFVVVMGKVGCESSAWFLALRDLLLRVCFEVSTFHDFPLLACLFCWACSVLHTFIIRVYMAVDEISQGMASKTWAVFFLFSFALSAVTLGGPGGRGPTATLEGALTRVPLRAYPPQCRYTPQTLQNVQSEGACIKGRGEEVCSNLKLRPMRRDQRPKCGCFQPPSPPPL